MKRYGKLFDSGYWLDAQWWYPEEDFMQLGESYDAQGIAYNAIAADNAKKVENFYNLTKQHEKLLAARDLAALASATLREESIAKNDRIRALEAELNEQARVNGMGGSREAALLAKVATLEADLARCRAANVYDAEAHRKAARVENLEAAASQEQAMRQCLHAVKATLTNDSIEYDDIRNLLTMVDGALNPHDMCSNPNPSQTETICAHRWYISNTATQTCYACGATQHGNGPIIPKETKAELPRCSKCGAPGGDDHGKK